MLAKFSLDEVHSSVALKDDLAKLEQPMARWSNDLADVKDNLYGTSLIIYAAHKCTATNLASLVFQRLEILESISSEPYWRHHQDERETFVENTGNWLISHPVFQQWKDESSSSLLWLHGVPDSGKSKLTYAICESASFDR